MLHACAAKFDVTMNLENFLLFGYKAIDAKRSSSFAAKRRGREKKNPKQRTGLDGRGASSVPRAGRHAPRAQPPNKGHGREPPAPMASPFSGRQLPCLPASLLFRGRSFF